MRIIALTNSQGSWIDTDGEPYTHILARKKDFTFYSIAQSGITVTQILPCLDDFLKTNNADIVVLNLGIVEVVNRILSDKTKKLLYQLPLNIGKKITSAIWKKRKYWLQLRELSYIPYCKMSTDSFGNAFNVLLQEIGKYESIKHTIVLSIPEATKEYEFNVNPYINKYIEVANIKISDLCHNNNSVSLIDVNHFLNKNETYFIPNTVHFNSDGHELVADHIFKTLINLKNR